MFWAQTILNFPEYRMKVLLRKVLGLGLFVTEFLMKRIENYIEDLNYEEDWRLKVLWYRVKSPQ